MTAHDTNRVKSDNSTSPAAGRPGFDGGAITPTRDPRLRRIAEYATNRNASITRNDVAALAGWTLTETDEHIERLEAANLAQLIQSGNTRIVLLTERGEQLARGEL